MSIVVNTNRSVEAAKKLAEATDGLVYEKAYLDVEKHRSMIIQRTNFPNTLSLVAFMEKVNKQNKERGPQIDYTEKPLLSAAGRALLKRIDPLHRKGAKCFKVALIAAAVAVVIFSIYFAAAPVLSTVLATIFVVVGIVASAVMIGLFIATVYYSRRARPLINEAAFQHVFAAISYIGSKMPKEMPTLLSESQKTGYHAFAVMVINHFKKRKYAAAIDECNSQPLKSFMSDK